MQQNSYFFIPFFLHVNVTIDPPPFLLRAPVYLCSMFRPGNLIINHHHLHLTKLKIRVYQAEKNENFFTPCLKLILPKAHFFDPGNRSCD